MAESKNHKEKPKIRIVLGASTPEWMLSFGDLVSCLLVFFVLLVTFSTPDEGKLMQAFGAFQGAFGVVSPIIPGGNLKAFREDEVSAGGKVVGGVDEKGTMHEDNLSPMDLKSISVVNKFNNLKGKLYELGFKHSVSVQELNEGIIIRVPMSELFTPKTADFKPSAVQFLVNFANFSGSVGNEVLVRACFLPRESNNAETFSHDWLLARERAFAIGASLTTQYNIAESRFSYGSAIIDKGEDAIEFLLVEKLGTRQVSLADIMKKLLKTDAKEIKKYEVHGAPLWMAQYVVLVLILIVFFMILITLQKTQQGGMKSGSGDITNAIGGGGGVGVFKFGRYGTGTYMPTPTFFTKGVHGVDKTLVAGKGGTGDTDAEVDKKNEGSYLRVDFPLFFEKNSYQLTREMKEELSKMGLAFSLYESKVNVKCYTNEMPEESDNLRISYLRAAQIMRGLHSLGGLPYSKLNFSSYPSPRYLLPKDRTEKDGGAGGQKTYFYVYVPSEKNAATTP